MEISKKTDYALRMLAALVIDPQSVVSVRTAAKESGVPYSFARSIQHDLALAGIVTNTRGAAGGMRLACDPATTTLLDVVEAVQGPIVISGCFGGEDGRACARLGGCHFSPVWCNAEQMLRDYFGSVTLHQLVVDHRSPVFNGSFALVDEKTARLMAHEGRRRALQAAGSPSLVAAAGGEPARDVLAAASGQ